MKVTREEIRDALNELNPWWRGGRLGRVLPWRRAAYTELERWVLKPPAPRAVLLSGARQVGKTTLLIQLVDELIKQGVPPGNILYATFDNPLLKLTDIDTVLKVWQQTVELKPGLEYLFLDEAQFIKNRGTWVKHQVDFSPLRRIVFTGSAMPLLEEDPESGVGRWHTIKLTTLSFFEYLKLKQEDAKQKQALFALPHVVPVSNLQTLFDWRPADFAGVSLQAQGLAFHFHEFLLRGGFPQTALVDDLSDAQRILRDDIIDKALKRDMTALFKVRRIVELEQLFIYLCRHDGGVVDISNLTKEMGVTRPTVQHYIDLLESAHLIYKLPPYGYGKEVLRGRYKVYLADAAIAPAVMLRGRALLELPDQLGVAAETAVLKHLFARYYEKNIQFSYWRDRKDREVDLVADLEGQVIPFEVKYRQQIDLAKQLVGYKKFLEGRKVQRGYIVTRMFEDFGITSGMPVPTLKIPAALLCYWLGQNEIKPTLSD